MKKALSFTFKILVLILLVLIYIKVSYVPKAPPKQYAKPLTMEQKYENLSKVSVSVQIDYLKQYLGEPAAIYDLKDKKQKEYIFVDSDYYALLTSDLNNTILSYSITARSLSFNPTLKVKGIKVVLGKTTFFNDGTKPSDCVVEVGNTAPSYYYEKYEGWNGTGYENYLLGYNDAAVGAKEMVWSAQVSGEEIDNNTFKITDGKKCILPSDQDRKKYTVNTFGVGEPMSIGVNRRSVELIN